MIQSASGFDRHDTWLGDDSRYRHQEPQRVMLLVGAAGTVSERLIHALSREFPWIVVEQVEHVAAAFTAFSHPVSLILVDMSLLKAVEDASGGLSQTHPQALTAIIDNDDHSQSDNIQLIFESRLVRGVLPMNLRLDVWLAVIRLMLCGGEYYPPGIVRSIAGNGGRFGPLYPENSGSDVSGLTTRELQILEMVSRGLQNKTIATEFDLSEHTVKIHLHNIISKLGAHNRTEAAAKFRNFQLSSSSKPPVQLPLSDRDRLAGRGLRHLPLSK